MEVTKKKIEEVIETVMNVGDDILVEYKDKREKKSFSKVMKIHTELPFYILEDGKKSKQKTWKFISKKEWEVEENDVVREHFKTANVAILLSKMISNN